MIDILGTWKKGYVFDIHTVGSEYKGENEYGHPIFNTIRSPMGQYLYELKYGQKIIIIEKIINLLLEDSNFIKLMNIIDIILPIPPSNKNRRLQPVILIAQEIAKLFKKEIRKDILASSNYEEIKNFDINEKYSKIKNSISIEGEINKSMNILIFDDIFDSGSTLMAVTNALKECGYENI
jgi:predicted amidophosphoribosyltransferase